MAEVQEQMAEEKRRERADRDEEATVAAASGRQRNYFMADGRPFNINENRLAFRLQDDRQGVRTYPAKYL
jgi:hypothetical protein